MTAASNSEGRKRRTIAADPAEIVARTVLSHIVVAETPVVHCLCGLGQLTITEHSRHVSQRAVAALEAAGLLTPP